MLALSGLCEYFKKRFFYQDIYSTIKIWLQSGGTRSFMESFTATLLYENYFKEIDLTY